MADYDSFDEADYCEFKYIDKSGVERTYRQPYLPKDANPTVPSSSIRESIPSIDQSHHIVTTVQGKNEETTHIQPCRHISASVSSSDNHESINSLQQLVTMENTEDDEYDLFDDVNESRYNNGMDVGRSVNSIVNQTGGKELDIRSLYKYEVVPLGDKTWKNFVRSGDYRIQFSPDIERMDDPEQIYSMCIIDLCSIVLSEEDKSDYKVGISLSHEDLAQDMCFTFSPIESYTPLFMKHMLNSMAQSGKSMPSLNSNKFRMTVTVVKKVSGSGKRMTTGQIIEKLAVPPNLSQGNTRDSSWRNLTKNNVENYCLGVAVVQAIAFDEHRRDPTNIQKKNYFKLTTRVTENARTSKVLNSAKLLLRNAGIYKRNNFGIDEVKMIQQYYRNRYQILLFNDHYDTLPIYQGPYLGEDRSLVLLLKDNHYIHVKYLASFLNTQFYCIRCNAKNSTARRHYNCPLVCRLCLRRSGNCEDDVEILCDECGLIFHSRDCYNAHKANGLRGGKSRCEETIKCPRCHEIYFTERKREHICGHRYCSSCKTQRTPDHACMLSVDKRNDKQITGKRIFFDFETTAVVADDGKEYHEVVLAMALRACNSCKSQLPNNLQEAEDLHCDNCSQGSKRFWSFENVSEGNEDVNVIREFSRWLVGKHHIGFTAIAHNMKGYDGQFILRELFDDDIPTPDQLILAGSKVNYIKVAGVRIIDSFNFIQAPLSTFSKAFEVPEFIKGEFPFKFLKKENYGYEGPLPDIQYYGIEERAKGKREETLRFHQEKSNEANYIFNFRRELFTYCYGDVALLAAAMLKFEETFEKLTKVVIFEETITAASAAMKTFRRNFLCPDTIALDVSPDHNTRHSKIACQYLLWRQRETQTPIEMACTTGEHKIPNSLYSVDGFIPPNATYPRGLAIEVKGCYWHAHSCSYSPSSIVHGEMTAAEIRARDSCREQTIRSYCDLEIVWVCEIETQRKLDPEMDDFISNCEIQGQVNPVDALYGGRTEPIRLKANIGVRDDNIFYVGQNRDFCSLYPSVMKKDPYPLGSRVVINGSTIQCPIARPEDLSINGIIRCKIIPPRNLHLPVIPSRVAGKLMFHLCKACCIPVIRGELPKSGCSHTEQERSFTGTYTSMELKLALTKGYIIDEVYGALHWDEWSVYSKDGDTITHNLFSKYVDCFLKLKVEATGYPPEVGSDEQLRSDYIQRYYQVEGIRLDRDAIAKKPVIRQVSKLLLNSLWGKFAERSDRPQTKIIENPRDLFRIVENPTLAISQINIINASKIAVAFHTLKDCLEPLPTSSMHLAVFTTSHARIRLYKALDMIPHPEDNVCYMDTDSILYTHPRDSDPLEAISGEFLGDLTCEVTPGSEMTKFVTVGPKSYGIEERRADGSVSCTIKSKGFSKNEDAERRLTMNNLEAKVDQVLSVGKSDDTVITYSRIERDKLHRVFNRIQKKKFRFTFNKRIILSCGGTRPIGYSA